MSTSPGPALPHPPRWLTAAVASVATLVFLPTLMGGFLADDFVYIARFRELPWSEWPRLFVQEWSGGIWGDPLRELRPFAALSFMGDARLFGGDPLGYRLTSLVLHTLATLLVFRLAWLYSAGKTVAAAIAGLIFAVHPAHAETVTWITGRVDLLATTAALIFWLSAEVYSARGHRGRLLISAVALFIGIFSKEFCVFAPLLLLLRWLLLDLSAGRTVWRRRAALLATAVAVLAVYIVCRRIALPHDSIGYNLWTDVPAWHRQTSYAGWLVPLLPFSRHAEWQNLPPLSVLHGIWITLAIATTAGLAWTIRRRAHTASAALFFGGLWYFVTVAPLTAVVYMSPRHLYFPSVGLALAVGLACATTRIGRSLAALLLGWCLAAHVAAVRPWHAAASTSRAALAALDRELGAAGPGTLTVTAIPARLGAAWLWPWCSPQCFDAPFLSHRPERVIELPINLSRPGDWRELRQPVETVRTARAIVALYVDDRGSVFCRRLRDAELKPRAEELAERLARDSSPESWTAWVRSLAQP